MAESSQNRQKTPWEKEKLLDTSNFSFSHSVFKRLVSQGGQKLLLCGNGLNVRKKVIFTFPLVEKYYGINKEKLLSLFQQPSANRVIEQGFLA